jgi:hypothetical protein
MYYVVFPTIPTLELLGTQLPVKLFSQSYIFKKLGEGGNYFIFILF